MLRQVEDTMSKRIALVYQAGIANVFEIEGANLGKRTRLLQGDFRNCEWFARGCQAMGAQVESLYCNKAGDVAGEHWFDNLDDAPFSDQFNPVGKCLHTVS
jgi:hypothetical protein